MEQPIHNTPFAVLQQEILQLQGFRMPAASERMDMGLGTIEAAFPNRVFPLAAVHEFISNTQQQAAATAGFVTVLLKALMGKGSCLWVSTRHTAFPPALTAFGILPDQIIFVDVKHNRDALWTIEEGLKCGSLAAVVGEVQDLNFTESRRLQLAVEQSNVAGLIHRCINKKPGNLACVSRWMIQPLASFNEEGLPGVGYPQWEVALQKVRNGKPGRWRVCCSPEGLQVNPVVVEQEVLPIRKIG